MDQPCPHLEASHLEQVPVPLAPPELQQQIHRRVVSAYNSRDQAQDLLDQTEARLYQVLGLNAFTESDIQFMHPRSHGRIFTVTVRQVGSRLDASNHVPIVKSVLDKLTGGPHPLAPLSSMCSIVIPARFKRRYVETGHGVPYLIPSQMNLLRRYGMKAVAERQAAEAPEYLLQEHDLLLTTDGSIGGLHLVTNRMVGWFASNNIARLSGTPSDMAYLYAFLASPYGQHQLKSAIYGGVVDHINEFHIGNVMVPIAPGQVREEIAELVHKAFALKDLADDEEDHAIGEVERLLFQPAIQ